MEREPSGFPFLEINNILTKLKCLQLGKKVVSPLFRQAAGRCPQRPDSLVRQVSRADEDIGPYAKSFRFLVGAAISRPHENHPANGGRMVAAPTSQF